MKQYNVILADPPWQYRVWSRDTGQGRSAEAHYKTKMIDRILALNVNRIAAPNCALFLWTTWPTIYEYPPQVFEAWGGFTYRTLGFEWIKLLKRWHKHLKPLLLLAGHYDHFIRLTKPGMGHYTRANGEPCLLAVRGRMPRHSKKVRNLIFAPVGEHSAKPAEQYDLIETLYPPFDENGNRLHAYLELYARGPARPGWDTWGWEADDPTPGLDDILTGGIHAEESQSQNRYTREALAAG